MGTVILIVFAIAIVTTLVVMIPRSVRALRADAARPRSERERERDSRSAVIWLLVVVIVVGALCLAYLLTRSA